MQGDAARLCFTSPPYGNQRDYTSGGIGDWDGLMRDVFGNVPMADDGQVLVNGIDIYRHFDAVRNEIGFVPQKDIIHVELTVYQALDYAARLRMPADTTPEERHRRVVDVMEDLDLVHRKDVPISGLSGGQQKRVSIGVELLTRPDGAVQPGRVLRLDGTDWEIVAAVPDGSQLRLELQQMRRERGL